ncbi:MAG: GNAT family N-acetyltransferase [Spirochaetota bacterium]
MIRKIKEEEQKDLLAIAHKTGIFPEGEVEELLGSTLSGYFSGELEERHHILAIEDEVSRKAVGWSYFAPSFHAEGVWDIWWIGIDSSVQQKGYGSKLLLHIEKMLKEQAVRLIIIETSSMETLAKARKFYPKLGYQQCGIIPNFYAVGDDKVIFAKNI